MQANPVVFLGYHQPSRGQWLCPACSGQEPPAAQQSVGLAWSWSQGIHPGGAVACPRMLSFPSPLTTLFQEGYKACHLTDNQAETFWESNGSVGQHWVRLNMKKGAIVK